jgi:hypothetical protein
MKRTMNKMISNMRRFSFILIAIIIVALTLSCQKAEEPLLWEKEYAEAIVGFDLAEDTGDVLIIIGNYGKGKVMFEQRTKKERRVEHLDLDMTWPGMGACQLWCEGDSRLNPNLP